MELEVMELEVMELEVMAIGSLWIREADSGVLRSALMPSLPPWTSK
jgi:hypothetical protein